MDLPTYTNIWRIEKRLYKLYDLRLPMPLPIVWIGVFVGVSAFWWVLLQMVGLPFDAPWHVIYLVPPGIVTWLSTRPVIENKRLTELMQSQARYLSEPKTWCRLAPSGEPDVIDFQAKVWRASTVQARVKKPKRAPEPQRATVRPAVAAAAAAATPLVEEIPVRVKPPLTTTASAHASRGTAPRLIGHPDDKQTSYPGEPSEQRRRPASFGQPPPAGPAGIGVVSGPKDPARPFAGSPLRPAFLAHPSDRPQPAPETPARPAAQGGLRPQASDTPSRPAAEAAPAVPQSQVQPASLRPQASDVPSHSAAKDRPQIPEADTRPVARGQVRSEGPGVSAPKAQAADVPVESAPPSPVSEEDTRPVSRERVQPEAPAVPAPPVAESSPSQAPRAGHAAGVGVRLA